MDPNSLYYFFSTNAQVLAAISALLAIFTQFKLSELNTFLIGDGMATFERMSRNEGGYTFSDAETHTKYLNRLRDAISRKSIAGIQEVIIRLAFEETSAGKDEVTNPRGLNFLKTRFSDKEDLIEFIKKYTKRSILVSFITILISLTSLVFVQYIKSNEAIASLIVIGCVIGTLFSMIFTIVGVYKGLEPDIDW